MNENNQPKKKDKENEQEVVINIGDISSISGSKIEIPGEGSPEADSTQEIKTSSTDGGIYIEGSVNTGGGDFVGRDTIDIATTNKEDFFRLLMAVSEKINKENASPEDKEDLHELLREIADEAVKGDATDEPLLTRRLRTLGKVSPDVLDTFLDTFGKEDPAVSSVLRAIVTKMQSD